MPCITPESLTACGFVEIKNPAEHSTGFFACSFNSNQFQSVLTNFLAVKKNDVASGKSAPIHAIGAAKQAPKYPSQSTKKIAAAILIINSIMPANVGTKLFPKPCNVNRKINNNANAQYDSPVIIKNNRPYSTTC